MANGNNTADIGFEQQIWAAADILRGNMDASEYKHVVLGLIFLKYISDKFDERYQELKAADDDVEDKDAYTEKNIFFVPPSARWSVIAEAAHREEIGTVIDDAMRAIEKENKRLKDVLPKNFARGELDKRRLGNVVDLFTNIQMVEHGTDKDILGRTYEYCLQQFASKEGKRGGEYYTPSCMVRTLVAVLKPSAEHRIYDPCCGSGGMFVQSERFVREHSGERGHISIYGQDSNPTTRKLAMMNLAIRGIEADLGAFNADTFTNDLHPQLKADFILANPPFNLSDWNDGSLNDDPRWKYGLPPTGNANFAWLQHMIYHLAPNGKIGMVLANGSLSSQSGGEGEIRRKIVEDDLVEGIVAMPSNLFYGVTIPATLWFVSRNKKQRGKTLFVDARKMGTLIDRVHRELSDEEIEKIAATFEAFDDGTLEDVKGYCAAVTTEDIVANQWTIVENSEKRPDVLVFINGLPVVVFELKSPSREETDASEAFLQLRNYMHEIPSLFIYNAFLVMSDLATSKAGTITAGEDRFMEWKTKDGSYENTQYAQFDTFIEGMFDKARLLDIIKNFICFSGTDAKILGAYHQYFAVKKAIASTEKATKTDGKGGVFWHTQGSGKSLSMVFYAHLLQHALNAPTIVVLTDRNDLDDQLFEQFAKCSDFLRQTPQQAESRENLKELLLGRQANGIIFTTAQKFEESNDTLSDRHNIIVMADEAHRSQFIDEKVDAKTGRIQKSFGLIIRESLPNATYIGFTGTPISTKDRSTIEVFGNYIDIYDMTQAVEDGATRPVYYESRVIHLKLDENVLHLIDAEYDLMAENAEPYAIEKSKKELGQMESILGADQTIAALCEDIVKHYEQNRQQELTGKAMIVAYSRAIAMKIYRKLMELRPKWGEKVGVVMTESNKDPEEWRSIIGNKRHRDEMAAKFKNNDDPLKIAIVVDMWLTGFDVPSLATMYVYKPMSGHIARF